MDILLRYGFALANWNPQELSIEITINEERLQDVIDLWYVSSILKTGVKDRYILFFDRRINDNKPDLKLGIDLSELTVKDRLYENTV